MMAAHFIDVGQGSAVLLEFSCGALMVDTGGQAVQDTDNLLDYLTRFFRRRTDLARTIETVFITHNHVDHTRALVQVADSFRIRNIIEHGKRGGPNDQGDRPLRRLIDARATNGITFVDLDQADVAGGLTTELIDPLDCASTNPEITVLSADQPTNPGWSVSAFNNKNNHSLVIRVDFGVASFLFTGDLEEEGIEALLAEYEGTTMLDVDVYHVGHHGSANATTWDLLEAIDWPVVSVITMGPCNRNVGQFNAFQFGHPRASVIEMLRAGVTRRRSPAKQVPVARGVRDFQRISMRDAIYATGWDGTIVVRASRGGRYRVSTEAPTAPARCG
jgi:competence protein ComEC